MEPGPEDLKIITLARSARARVAAAEGAAVRDETGRTYAAAAVALPSLKLSALRLAVAMAVSSGASSLEAAALVSDADGGRPGRPGRGPRGRPQRRRVPRRLQRSAARDAPPLAPPTLEPPLTSSLGRSFLLPRLLVQFGGAPSLARAAFLPRSSSLVGRCVPRSAAVPRRWRGVVSCRMARARDCRRRQSAGGIPIRLRLLRGQAQCRQVDIDERAGGHQGRDHQQPAADHPAGHPGDRAPAGRAADHRGHPRPAPAAHPARRAAGQPGPVHADRGRRDRLLRAGRGAHRPGRQLPGQGAGRAGHQDPGGGHRDQDRPGQPGRGGRAAHGGGRSSATGRTSCRSPR